MAPVTIERSIASRRVRRSPIRLPLSCLWKYAALFLVALPASAFAQSDCESLQKFVRQAPDGFEPYVSGRAEPQSFDANLDRSPANVSWNGADCTVASHDDVLRCSWQKASFPDSVKMVAACLPGSTKVVAEGETFFTAPVTHVIVTVSGSDGTNDVLIEIRAP
jgi:hypothetical protein